MNIYCGRCTFSTLTVTSNLTTCKAHFTQVTRACCLQSLVFVKVELLSISATKATDFPSGWIHNELKAIWCIAGQETFCHKVGFFLFFFFLLVFCWRGKMTSTSSSSLTSFHIYKKLNGRRECKALYEEKGTVK